MEEILMDCKTAAALLVEFDDLHVEMADLLVKVADAADIDQDVMQMKHNEFKNWVYRAFQEKFGEEED
jgi:hypothetical protein